MWREIRIISIILILVGALVVDNYFSNQTRVAIAQQKCTEK